MAGVLRSDVLTRLRAEGGAALVADLAALLARTAPARLAQIDQGVADNDRVAVVRASHSLRSSAGNFGAADLAQAALTLEQLAESPERWLDAQARNLAVADVAEAWSDVADRIRALAATRADPS